MKYIIFNKKTKQYYFSQEDVSSLKQNEIKILLNNKQIEILTNNKHNSIFIDFNQTKHKLILFNMITDWQNVINNRYTKYNISILQKIKNQLWLNTQHFYQGRHHYHLQNNLARSQVDAYQLGMINYQRIKKGKATIGDIVINPDNQYMLANLSWGQKIWSLYYKKCKEIQEAFNKGQQIINCNIGYKEQLGQKPYSFSQILNWQKQHQND